MSDQIDIDREFLNATRAAIFESLKTKLSGYQSPLDPLIQRAVARHSARLESVIDEAIQSVTGGDDFRQQMRDALSHVIAKQLIAKLGGEVEKQVNQLKANPTTRAQITLAINRIVSGQAVQP